MAAAAMIAAATVGSAAGGWTVVSGPRIGELANVSCISSTSCMGVGSLDEQTFAATWDGSAWATTPVPRRGIGNYLNGVSCTSTTFCAAVGTFFPAVGADGDENRTLVETWNGTAWSFVASPNKTTLNSGLYGVSCTSTTFCVAVGSYSYSRSSLALVETWNGSAWSIVAAPPRSNDSFLYGVSCTSTTSCMAVGGYYSSDLAKTLVERWNGAAWSIVASPNPANDSQLKSVSCTSSIQCAAVGDIEEGSSGSQTLAETWNGRAWSIVASPSHGTYSALDGVYCVSSSACVAVGYEGGSPDGAVPMVALVETWDGAAWSVTGSPQGQQALFSVSCTSLTRCLAVANYTVETGPA